MNRPSPSCEEVIAHLFSYLDGELEDMSQAEIERHLAWCRDCFSRVEFERRLKARLVETGTAKASEGLRDRVRMLIARY